MIFAPETAAVGLLIVPLKKGDYYSSSHVYHSRKFFTAGIREATEAHVS